MPLTSKTDGQVSFPYMSGFEYAENVSLFPSHPFCSYCNWSTYYSPRFRLLLFPVVEHLSVRAVHQYEKGLEYCLRMSILITPLVQHDLKGSVAVQRKQGETLSRDAHQQVTYSSLTFDKPGSSSVFRSSFYFILLMPLYSLPTKSFSRLCSSLIIVIEGSILRWGVLTSRLARSHRLIIETDSPQIGWLYRVSHFNPKNIVPEASVGTYHFFKETIHLMETRWKI